MRSRLHKTSRVSQVYDYRYDLARYFKMDGQFCFAQEYLSKDKLYSSVMSIGNGL